MKLATFVLCCVVSPSLAAQEGTVQLRLKPTPSTTVMEETTSKLSFSFSVLGQTQRTKAEQFQKVEVKTGPRLPDGSVKVVRTTRQMKASISAPGGKSIKLDSAKPKTNGPAYFKTQLDTRLAYVFDSDNKLRAATVENPEALAELSDAQKNAFQSESLMAARLSGGAWLPEKSLAVGDSWEREEQIRIDSRQGLGVTLVYTYQGLHEFDGRQLHRIDTQVKSTKLVGGEDAWVTAGELKPLSSSKGTVWFDTEAGRVENLAQKIRLRGSVSANVGGRKFKTRLTVNFDSSLKLSVPEAGKTGG